MNLSQHIIYISIFFMIFLLIIWVISSFQSSDQTKWIDQRFVMVKTLRFSKRIKLNQYSNTLPSEDLVNFGLLITLVWVTYICMPPKTKSALGNSTRGPRTLQFVPTCGDNSVTISIRYVTNVWDSSFLNSFSWELI